MPITHRFRQRQTQLEKPFQKKVLKELWKNKVKSQVRSMAIQDMHDFYDFHRRLDENVSKIEELILSGQYKAQMPLVHTLEKKLGICRHMIIPSPTDTLILQALIQPFSAELEKSAPSKQAYYSRDKSTAIKLPHEIGSDYDDWFSKWKLYQKEILEFTDTKQYVITTDLSNYYDSIRLRELRSVISGHIQINCPEVFLDLIFDITESLSWRPDYLPSQFIGLPVINLEAIRLLAHAFLFEVDIVLQQQVKEHFVRWMDDIVIGVDDIDEAKKTLKSISDVLKSRGLALNMAKTRILTSEDAKKHFLFDENIKLNTFSENPISEREFMNAFRSNWKNNKNYRYFDKALKRYITLAGDRRFHGLLKYLPDIFDNFSGLRSNVCTYLYKLGFNKKNASTFLKLLDINKYDDITLFLLVGLATDWNIGFSKAGREFV